MQSASVLTRAPATLAPIVAGLLLTLLLAALDATIVATAMPGIATDLRGFERYSWVTVAYLLTSTVCVPVVGKLADQYGRRVFLLGGASTFVVSSVLCALAGSFEQLVAFRLLQGVGAGTITAAVFAAVPRLFAPSAAARLVGLFSATYGLASIVGPLLGGVISDGVGWRGVFWINIPIAVIAIALVLITYPRDGAIGDVGPVDYGGALTLIGGMSPVLLALLVGGRDIAWDSPGMAALLAFGSALLAAFVWIERRAVEPIIPLRDLATRALGAPVLGSALMNAGLIGVILFTPLFVQGVTGESATQSGGVLAPMLAAWVVASVIGGQIIARIGRTRPVGVVGMAIATGGVCLLAAMGPNTGQVTVTRNLLVVGMGLGTALPAFIIAAQNAISVERAGTALGLSTFARAIGATLSSAGLGGLLTASLGATRSSAKDPVALSAALSSTFVVAAAVVAFGVAAAWLIRERPLGDAVG